MICWPATVNKWTILDGNWYESGRFRMIMNDFVGQCGRSSVGWLTVYETVRKHCLFSRAVHFQSLESSRFTPIDRPLWTWPFNRLLNIGHKHSCDTWWQLYLHLFHFLLIFCSWVTCEIKIRIVHIPPPSLKYCRTRFRWNTTEKFRFSFCPRRWQRIICNYIQPIRIRHS